jgi:predicted nucleotidyltransferase
MRLSKEEQLAIKGVLSKFDPNGKVYLFGSRVDNLRRGGDIDLLIRSKKLTLSDRLDIVCELEDAMGLRKIDLVIDNGRPNSFVRSVESGAIRL